MIKLNEMERVPQYKNVEYTLTLPKYFGLKKETLKQTVREYVSTKNEPGREVCIDSQRIICLTEDIYENDNHHGTTITVDGSKYEIHVYQSINEILKMIEDA